MTPEARSDADTISLRVIYLRIVFSFSLQTSSKYFIVAELFRLRPVRQHAKSVRARVRSFREYFVALYGGARE